jgi:hypothetical protein
LWVAISGGRVANILDACRIRLIANLRGGDAVQTGVTAWQLAQVRSLRAKVDLNALSTSGNRAGVVVAIVVGLALDWLFGTASRNSWIGNRVVARVRSSWA